MASGRHTQRLLNECLEAFGQIEILPVNPQTIAEVESHYQQFKEWASFRRQALLDSGSSSSSSSKVSERTVVSLLRRLRKQLAALKPTHHGLAEPTTVFYSDSSSSENSDSESTPGARPLRKVSETLALLYELVPAGTASGDHEPPTQASLQQQALRAKAAQLEPMAEQALSILFKAAQPYLPKRLAAAVTERSLALFNRKHARPDDDIDSAVAEFGSACYHSIDSLMRLVIAPPTTLDLRSHNLTERLLPPLDAAQCPHCFCAISGELEDPRQWAAHVLADIRPYMCIHEDCADSAERFANRDEWITHLQWSHNAAWICPFTGHSSRTFAAADKFERHIQVRHGNQCTKNQRQLLQQSCYRPFRHPFSRDTLFTDAQGVASLCPFCPFGLDELESVGGDVVSDNASIREKAENNLILSHVAQHMELVALLSVVEPADLLGGPAPASSQRHKKSAPNSKKPRTRATSSPTAKDKPPSKPPAMKAPSPPLSVSPVDFQFNQRPRTSSGGSTSSGQPSPRPGVPPVPIIPAQFKFPTPPRSSSQFRGAPTPPSSPRNPGDDHTFILRADASDANYSSQLPGQAISTGLSPSANAQATRSRSYSPMPLSPPPDRAIPAIPSSANHAPSAPRENLPPTPSSPPPDKILPSSPPPDRPLPASPPPDRPLPSSPPPDRLPPSIPATNTVQAVKAEEQPAVVAAMQTEVPAALAATESLPDKISAPNPTPSRFKKTLAALKGSSSTPVTHVRRAPPPSPISISPAPPSRASQTPPMLSPRSEGGASTGTSTLLDFLRDKWAEENAIDAEDRKGMAAWPGL